MQLLAAQFERPGGQLFADLDRYGLWGTSGIPEKAHDILGGQSTHGQCQVAFEGCLDGASIDLLHILCGAGTTNQFHQEFCVLRSLLCCLAPPSRVCVYPKAQPFVAHCQRRVKNKTPGRELSRRAICLFFPIREVGRFPPGSLSAPW
jgi:hypothetical protein